ncbi:MULTISPECIES: ABC transporter ATP-binding protein [Prauserella salsuginis group]|uniref:ABC transporter ATP-binding protein n=1 Tax=Prauserella salsuginis TaxID=387889 RepID=A0ABW6G153_9PSEU|nr:MULTISPECIES: ABC transporter ATP-binding protein [Prauserella salsuginis group]MCR3722080.1 ABC-2 type transport system ATP-binding protein [Prauserella flava]MCR3736077.1 ABC-2 type transport system ATP-binding protein [Prauserella salsuginis]
MVQESVISARNVHMSFPDGTGGHIRAVDGVDLEVARGEVLALLGPNGAGKTTLLDILLGLTTARSGDVSVGGQPPRAAVQTGRLSALLQTGGLLPDLTAAETVRMIAALHADPADVDEVIDIAGVRPFASRQVGKCSGGQQQRLRFALALLPRPEIIVLDEPTAGMDVSARHEFWDRMRAQADEGITVIFATHYLEEAEQFARRTVLMNSGRVLADGPTDEVRARAGAAYVTVTWDPAADELERLPFVIRTTREGARITFRTERPDELARHLLTSTDAHGLTVRPASLEEAFRLLTEESTDTGDTERPATAAPEEVSA